MSQGISAGLSATRRFACVSFSLAGSPVLVSVLRAAAEPPPAVSVSPSAPLCLCPKSLL